MRQLLPGGIQEGIVAGLLTVALFAGLHTWNNETLLQPGWWGLSWLFYLTAMYLAARNVQGTEQFRQRLKAAFLTFIVANLLFYAYYYALLRYIDPDLINLQAERMAQYTQRENIELKEEDLIITPKKMILDYFYSLLGGFILSIGIAFLANRAALNKA